MTWPGCFANRVPLLYQQGSCAIWESVLETSWKNYHVEQSRGAPPSGPLVIMVHFASVWVPFTSESKEAIASYPEVVKETKLALQECGRRVSVFLSRRRREIEEERKKSYITKYIPHIGIGLREILGFPEKEEQKVVRQLTGILEKTRGA
jgi:DNA topoisomerase-6 subunit B